MHVPDGFIDAPVSVATGVVAAGAVAVSLRGARRELGGSGHAAQGGVDGTAPLAGLVAAFIFAVQMLNFPVAAGTSGHLLGGALAAILVGPYTGVLCVSVVLLMQGVLFADGGLTALGVNITDMGVVTVLVGYGVFRGLLKVLPRGRRRSVTVASFAAALLSVPAAAVCFTGIYALGGTADVALGKVFTAMVGVHVLIGIGEAVITAATVGAVMAVRPDLVHGARGLTRSLTLSTVTPVTPATPGAPARSAEAATGGAGAGTPGSAQHAATGAADALRPAGESAAPADARRAAPPHSADSPAPAATRQAADTPRSAASAAPATDVPGAESSGIARSATGAAGASTAAAPAAGGLAAREVDTTGGASGPAVAGQGAADGVVARAADAGRAQGAGGSGASAPKGPSGRKVWWAGVAAAAVCAGVVSFYASASPDGLEKVAADHGIGKQAEESSTADSPLADYSLGDITNDRLSGGLAGLIGVGGTLALGTGVFVVVRRRRTDDDAPAEVR